MEAPPSASPSTVTYTVHRCQFVEWQPSGITALQFNPRQTHLTVARQNGDIEFWNVTSGWHLEKKIPGQPDFNIRSLVWTTTGDADEEDKGKEVEERLFGATLQGEILEWNLSTLKPKFVTESFGGAVWGLAADHAGERLAAACEDGTVRLFAITPTSVDYVRALPKQKVRACCVAWHADDHDLVAGYADGTLRRWNAKSGNNLYRITVESLGKQHTVIWAVTILKDWTIVSGDSWGKTCFWDGKTGTLLHSFAQHQADVLCLATNKLHNKIFSAGIDNKTALFQLLDQEDGERRWMYTNSQRCHTHDIFAIAASATDVVTGGIDAQLGVMSVADFDLRAPTRIMPFPHRPVVSLARDARLLLSQNDTSLSLQRLGKEGKRTRRKRGARKTGKTQRGKATVEEANTPLLTMQLHSERNVLCSAISRDGQYIAASDIKQLRLWKLTYDENDKSNTGVEKITLQNMFGSAAHRLTFTPDSKRLIVATVDGDLIVYSLLKNDVEHTFSHSATTSQEIPNPPAAFRTQNQLVVSLAVSGDSAFFAAGDLNNIIHIYNLNTFKYHCTAPIYPQIHTAIAFHPVSHTLVTALSTNTFHLYDVDHKRQCDWTREYEPMISETALATRKEKIIGIAFDPAATNTVIFYGEGFFCYVDLDKPPKAPALKTSSAGTDSAGSESGTDKEVKADKEKDGSEKKRKRGRGKRGTETKADNFRLLTVYKPLMFLDFAEESELVVVERPWLSISQNLPDPLQRNKYRKTQIMSS